MSRKSSRVTKPPQRFIEDDSDHDEGANSSEPEYVVNFVQANKLISFSKYTVDIDFSDFEETASHDHFPVPTNSGLDKAQRASMGRQQCTLCKRSPPWQYEECIVGLCLQLERNCFRAYHKGQKMPGHSREKQAKKWEIKAQGVYVQSQFLPY